MFGVLNSLGRGNENEENSLSSSALVTITYVNRALERGILTVGQWCSPPGHWFCLQILLGVWELFAMHPDSPAR